MGILLPLHAGKSAYRIVTMPKKVMNAYRAIHSGLAEARIYTRVLEQESKAAQKMAHDELKLAHGPASKLQLPGRAPPTHGAPTPHSPPPGRAVPPAKPAPPGQHAAAKPGAHTPAKPGAGPLAQAAEKNLKDLEALRMDFKRNAMTIERYRRDAKALAKIRNKLKYDAAYLRFQRAQNIFATKHKEWAAKPQLAGGEMAKARSELEGAFADMMAAM